MVCLCAMSKSRLNLFLLIKNFIDHCFAIPYFSVEGTLSVHLQSYKLYS